jgi:pimeloyl-ACP methyl ester carboxylesterase
MSLPTLVPAPAEVFERCLELHGQRISYLASGADSGGPVVVLVHGLASNRNTWSDVLPLLGRYAHVIAPDLLGSGASAKPRCADYSVGAHAARIRDLLRELGLDRASVVGHSYGGGVAMTFAYQFPERTDRMVLIASGGLGPELSIALRAASLPGAALAAHAVTELTPRWLAGVGRRLVSRLGWVPDADLAAAGRALHSLSDGASRRAFTHTVRCTVTWSGQRLAATDRLYLLSGLPTLLVAGRRDSCIPWQHSEGAHKVLPGSRLEVLDTGHFPHHEQPGVVGELLTDFLTGRVVCPVLVGPEQAAAC